MQNLNLTHYSKLMETGLYALINDEDRVAYTVPSKNILLSLYRVLERLCIGGYENIELQKDYQLGKLKLVILETGIEKEIDRLIACEWYKHNFVSNGYKLYKQKPAIKIQIKALCPPAGELSGKVVVVARYQQRDIILGIFVNMVEATKFIENTYSNLPFKKLIYSRNTLSLEYFKKFIPDVYRNIQMDGE